MIVRNLTAKLQEITVREMMGDGREYIIYLEPYSTTELERLIVVSKNINGILELGTPTIPVQIPVDEDETSGKVENPAGAEDEEEEEKEPEISTEKFICDICGGEFASARGLSSHKNKAHPEE